MKVNIFTPLFLFWFAVSEFQALKSSKVKEPVVCNTYLLKSYLIHGRPIASNEENVICPYIQENCCTKIDQQNIYHSVNEVVLPRLKSYTSRIKTGLDMLKAYFNKVVSQKIKYKGSNKRRFYCEVNKQKLKQFDYG